MTDKYRIDQDFVVPEPTAATFFCFWAPDEYSDEKRDAVMDGWREHGVQQVRITIVNDAYPHEPYPHGYWLEGWADKGVRMLPFGEAEALGKGCSPPLVATPTAVGKAETPNPTPSGIES